MSTQIFLQLIWWGNRLFAINGKKSCLSRAFTFETIRAPPRKTSALCRTHGVTTIKPTSLHSCTILTFTQTSPIFLSRQVTVTGQSWLYYVPQKHIDRSSFSSVPCSRSQRPRSLASLKTQRSARGGTRLHFITDLVAAEAVEAARTGWI